MTDKETSQSQKTEDDIPRAGKWARDFVVKVHDVMEELRAWVADRIGLELKPLIVAEFTSETVVIWIGLVKVLDSDVDSTRQLSKGMCIENFLTVTSWILTLHVDEASVAARTALCSDDEPIVSKGDEAIVAGDGRKSW